MVGAHVCCNKQRGGQGGWAMDGGVRSLHIRRIKKRSAGAALEKGGASRRRRVEFGRLQNCESSLAVIFYGSGVVFYGGEVKGRLPVWHFLRCTHVLDLHTSLLQSFLFFSKSYLSFSLFQIKKTKRG